MKNLEEITRKVVSYCEIPEALVEGSFLEEQGGDCFVEYTILTEEEKKLYDHDEFSNNLDDYLLRNYNVERGETILINIDY